VLNRGQIEGGISRRFREFHDVPKSETTFVSQLLILFQKCGLRFSGPLAEHHPEIPATPPSRNSGGGRDFGGTCMSACLWRLTPRRRSASARRCKYLFATLFAHSGASASAEDSSGGGGGVYGGGGDAPRAREKGGGGARARERALNTSSCEGDVVLGGVATHFGGRHLHA